MSLESDELCELFVELMLTDPTGERVFEGDRVFAGECLLTADIAGEAV